MTATNDTEQEMVLCKLCTDQVWIQKDRLEKHMQKAHSPKAAPKKSFTTYKARIASTYPPKVNAPTANRAGRPLGGSKITLFSRNGQRLEKGICAECGQEQPALWQYSESSQGPVDICSDCKTIVFERSFG